MEVLIQANFQQIIILLSGSTHHYPGMIILTGLRLALSIRSQMRLQLAHKWNTVTDLIPATGSIPTDNLHLAAGISIRLFFGNSITSHIGFNIFLSFATKYFAIINKQVSLFI